MNTNFEAIKDALIAKSKAAMLKEIEAILKGEFSARFAVERNQALDALEIIVKQKDVLCTP